MSFLVKEGHSKSTSDFESSQRFDYWCDIVCDEFVQLDCEQVKDKEFYGEIRGGVGVSSLRFSEVLSDPQLVKRSKSQIAKSAEADFLISFQLAKHGILRQDGREALLSPGSFALYDSTRPYSLEFQDRFHQLVIQMPNEVLSQHLMNPEKYTAISIDGQKGLGAVLSNFIFSVAQEMSSLHQAPEELSENLLNLIAMAFSSSLMLGEVGDNSVVQESLRRRVRNYIDNNLCDPELNNQAIALAQGISTRYLHKLFQREDQTIHSMIVSSRLERARSLLSDKSYSGHTIESIAYSVGFTTAAHFSSCFKRKYGVSPRDIR